MRLASEINEKVPNVLMKYVFFFSNDMSMYMDEIKYSTKCWRQFMLWELKTNRPWAGYRPPSPPGGILYTMIFWIYII